MPQKQEVTLYSFSELPEDIQNSLIKSHQVDYNWDDTAIQTIEQEAEELGIEDFDLQYSGFWRQGDGFSFTGTLSKELVEKVYKAKVNRDGFGEENPPFQVKIERQSSAYCHEKTVSAIVSGCLHEAVATFAGVFNDWKDEKCREWYDFLENSYESLTDEAYIREFYEDCGTIFLLDGRAL